MVKIGSGWGLFYALVSKYIKYYQLWRYFAFYFKFSLFLYKLFIFLQNLFTSFSENFFSKENFLQRGSAWFYGYSFMLRSPNIKGQSNSFALIRTTDQIFSWHESITDFTIQKHWHILIWTACCNTFWLNIYAKQGWPHINACRRSCRMIRMVCYEFCVGRCFWSNFVYSNVTQYIQKPQSRYFLWKSKSFYCLYCPIFSLVVSYGRPKR